MIKNLLSNLPLMNCLDRGLFLYERNLEELQRITKRSQFKKKMRNDLFSYREHLRLSQMAGCTHSDPVVPDTLGDRRRAMS